MLKFLNKLLKNLIVTNIIIAYYKQERIENIKQKNKKKQKNKRIKEKKHNNTTKAMASFKPLKPQDINVKKIEFAPIKKLDNGANIMYINYDGSSIYTTTPEFKITFDGKYWPDSDTSGKWPIKVNLIKDDKFTKFISELDTHLKDEAMKHSQQWFKKKNMSMETIETLYVPQVKEDLDPETGEPTGKYPPGFQFKIVKRDGKVGCKIYGKDKKEYNVNNTEAEDYVDVDGLLKKGASVKLLLKCNGIWIANGKFGCTWRAEQMKVTPVETFDDCVFDDSDEEEVEKIDRNFIDSDESEEDEEKDEPEPEVQTKKVRKVKKKE